MIMKALFVLAASVCWMGTMSLASAQMAVSTATTVPAAPTATIVPAPTTVPSGQINHRIKSQRARINTESKLAKRSQVQTNDKLAVLQAVKDKRNAFYAANGKDELKSAQQAELNAMLNTNKSLPTPTIGL